jgi:hypothetical protein
MEFFDDERGVSVQVGAVILLAFVVIAISTYQVQVVPSQNEEIEYNHNQRLQTQLQEVEASIGSMSATGDSRTVTVDLATTYPARTLFVNPPRPTGRLQTVGTTEPRVSFEVRNATAANPDVDDFWDGRTHNYSTGAIAYHPNYNVYQQAPTTVVANSLVYNEYASTTLVVNQQSVFDGDSISLVALRGSLRRDGGTASVNVRPVSASTTTVPVTATGSDNVTIALVSRLPADSWRELIDESGEYANQSGHVTAVVANGTTTLDGQQLYRVEFELERGQTYRLRLSRVGVGELSTSEQSTNASYTVAVTESITTEEDVNASVTVEVRDQYNNPKSGVEVNATVDGSAGGSIVDTPLTTNQDGRVTFTYETPTDVSGTSSQSDTVQVSFAGDPATGFDASAPENVSVSVTVQNTDGSGTGGGSGGGGGAYSITFDDAPSYSWNVSDEGSSLTLTASTSPALDGVSTDFAVNDSSVATVSSEDTSTDSSGDADVTLNAQSDGTVGVYVGSSGSSDVINVTVTNAGGGGGGNSPPTADAGGPYSTMEQRTVSLDGSGSSDPEGNIQTYEWQVVSGPGSISDSNINDPSAEYNAPNVASDTQATIELNVTDGAGQSDTTTTTVSIEANDPPTVNDIVEPAEVYMNQQADFQADASDPNGNIVSYEWDFDGDGNYDDDTGQLGQHTFSSPGQHTISVRVTDAYGASSNDSVPITVEGIEYVNGSGGKAEGTTNNRDSVVFFNLNNPGDRNVTITEVNITNVSGTNQQPADVYESNRNHEIMFDGDGDRVVVTTPEDGYAESASFTIGSTVTMDDTGIVVAGGPEGQMQFYEFRRSNGQPLDMGGATIVVDLTVQYADGTTDTITVTVNVP